MDDQDKLEIGDVVAAFSLLFVTLANELQNAGAMSVLDYRDKLLASKDVWPVQAGGAAAQLMENVLLGIDVVVDSAPCGGGYLKALHDQKARRIAEVRPLRPGPF